MPCYDPGPTDHYCYDCGTNKNRLDERTSQLCETLHNLEEYNKDLYVILVSKQIRDWHEQHKKFDEKRRQAKS